MKSPVPTGDIQRPSDNNPATVPVPTPVVMVHVEGNFTAFDRKLWVMLLIHEWDNLETHTQIGKWHEIPMSKIRYIIKKFSGSKDSEKIWESAKRLSQTTVEFRHCVNNSPYRTITSIFAAQCPEKETSDGVFRFMFHPALISLIKHPDRFARLRVHFLLGLRSKYTVTLYEILESVANRKNSTLKASVNELRSWLKVPEGKLKSWVHLWQRAIKPALDEINDKSIEAGFTVKHELIRLERKIVAVQFLVEKTPERLTFERKISRPKQQNLFHLPKFPGDVYDKAKKIAPGLDIYSLEAEWREWVKKTGKLPNKPVGSFLGFCKKKAREIPVRTAS